MQIKGTSAVVFGDAGGLGEATVRKLHGAGVKVVITDLSDQMGEALAGELDVPYVCTDVTNDDDVLAAIAAGEALGPLRISVDTHGGPAGGGRLVGEDGSPMEPRCGSRRNKVASPPRADAKNPQKVGNLGVFASDRERKPATSWRSARRRSC